jgi:hypothetical protein
MAEPLLRDALQSHTVDEIANTLNISSGTVRRWIELKSVPSQYQFDLLRLLGKQIDYTTFSSKEKDQFFTPSATAEYCWTQFREITQIPVDDYTFVEPSAGDGSFLSVLPDTTLAMDIEPRHPNVQSRDFLTWTPTDRSKPYIAFGNPPFGLRGHLALQFINHAATFADYVCFILPQLFESDGKGVPRKRVQGLHLLHSEKLTTQFYTPEKTDVNVNVVFQIWSKYSVNPTYLLQDTTSTKFNIYSLSDGGSASTTRNKHMIGKCDIYLPSTCFGKDTMRVYSSFEELPNRKGYGIVFTENKQRMIDYAKKVDWSSVCFLSTNSAFNLRTSIIAKQFNEIA